MYREVLAKQYCLGAPVVAVEHLFGFGELLIGLLPGSLPVVPVRAREQQMLVLILVASVRSSVVAVVGFVVAAARQVVRFSDPQSLLHLLRLIRDLV